MPIFKVHYGAEKSAKVTVSAASLDEVREKSIAKLKLPEDVSTYLVYDDSDGALIEDDDVLLEMAEFSKTHKGNHLTLTLLPADMDWSQRHLGDTARPLSPPASNSGTPPGTPGSSRCSTPETHFDASQRTETASTSEETPSASLALFPPIRPFVKQLEDAVNEPTHIRNKALVKAKSKIVQTLNSKLGSRKFKPGLMKSYLEQIRDKCPDAFKIYIKEQVVGDAFPQFVKSLYNARQYGSCVNASLSGTPKQRKRRIRQEDEDEPDAPPEVTLLCVDTNGCAEGMWEPEFTDEEEIMFEEKRKSLLDYNNMPGCDEDLNAKQLLKESYSLQRYKINRARTMDDWRQIFVSWPILLRKAFLISHCEILLGKKVLEVWNHEMRGHETFLIFMEQYWNKQLTNPSKGSPVEEMLGYMQKAREAEQSLQNRLPISQVTFPLTVGYFRENEGDLFLVEHATASDAVVLEKVKELCHCPVLVVRGSSIFDPAATFVIIVRGEFIVKASSFTEGILILMICYFAFNISYPNKIAKTLEFIQRFFLRINPEHQSRNEGHKKARINAVVSRLSSELAQFAALRTRWSIETPALQD